MKKIIIAVLFLLFAVPNVKAEECTSEMLQAYLPQANKVYIDYQVTSNPETYKVYVYGLSTGLSFTGINGGRFDDGYYAFASAGSTFSINVRISDGSVCALKNVKTVSVTLPAVSKPTTPVQPTTPSNPTTPTTPSTPSTPSTPTTPNNGNSSNSNNNSGNSSNSNSNNSSSKNNNSTNSNNNNEETTSSEQTTPKETDQVSKEDENSDSKNEEEVKESNEKTKDVTGEEKQKSSNMNLNARVYSTIGVTFAVSFISVSALYIYIKKFRKHK